MKTFKIYKNNKHINGSIYFNKSNLPRKKNKSTYNLKKVLKDRNLKFNNTLVDICFSSGFGNNINETKHLILNKLIKLNNKIVTKPNIKIKSGDVITCIDKNTLLNYYKQKWSIIKLNGNKKNVLDLEKIDFNIKNYSPANYINLKGRYKKLIISPKNDILPILKNKKVNIPTDKLIKKTYKKYKYLIANNKIHRLSYNSIIWL